MNKTPRRNKIEKQKHCTKDFDTNLYGDFCKERNCGDCVFYS